MGQHFGALQKLSEAKALNHTEKAMIHAPADEIPACSVPHSRCKEDDQKIHIRPNLPLPVSSKRNVQILLKPGAERNVPSLPEFTDGRADVGVVEVLQKLKAEHSAESDGHIRVTGEIIVNLQGIGQRTQPRHTACQ